MSDDRIPVAPSVLQWARLDAGFTLEQAAKKLAVSPRSLEKWESGSLHPTIKQLRKAAKQYRRPLAVLLLPQPPRDFQPVSDFRSDRDGVLAEWTPELRAEMKRATSQREVFLELAELFPSAVPKPVDLPDLPANSPTEEVGTALRSWLGMGELSPNLLTRPRELLNACVGAVEQRGVLVLQTQGVDLGEMRGFSLAEHPYPLIALNGKDWPRPKLFTLIHELAHLASNLGGLCDLHEHRVQRARRDDVEHYCNQVAGAVLIPRNRLLAIPAVSAGTSDKRWTLRELEDLSRSFGSSSEAMLLRLIGIGKADWETYRLRKPELEREYREARERERLKQKESEGGPSYYRVKARDLGHGYIASVLDAHRNKAISSLDAAVYLEVRYDQIPKLEAVVGR